MKNTKIEFWNLFNMASFKKLTLILISLLFLSFCFDILADFSIENWLFYKKIILPKDLPGEKNIIALKLDEEIFFRARSDLGDLRIIENDSEEIPFQMIKKMPAEIGEEEIARQGEIINPSSVHPLFREKSFGPEKMLDRNTATYFQSDYTKDPKETYFTIDLKSKILTKKTVILSTDPTNTWTSVKIEGSDDLENWQIIKGRTFIPFASQREIIYPANSLRYLKLSFEHTGSLKIHEIMVYTPIYSIPEIYLLFIGEQEKDYKLYYGNDLAKMPPYKIERLSLETAFFASLSAEYLNPKGKADYDNDNVPNDRDNCPFIANPDQRDTDEDKIGDACDNCPAFKNPNQLDKNNDEVGDVCEDEDKDGIVNILDNCPNYFNLDQKDENYNGIGDTCEDFDGDGVINDKDNCINNYNPDQGDKDKDGIGDACDPRDDRWTEKWPYLFWTVIILVIGTIIFFAFRLLKKMG